MKVKSIIVLILAFGLMNTAQAQESILVVTHKNTPIEAMSRQQVKNVYLGAPLSFDAQKLVLPSTSTLRQKFNTRVIGLSESRLRSYIAQMRFSGRAIALTEVSNVSEVIDVVSSNVGTIGYVSSTTQLPDNVRVIFRLDLD
jgi:hypothetical protein